LVGSSIDFKSFTINKYCFLILLSWVIGSINTIIAGYIILELSSVSFIFTINTITAVVIALYIMVFKKWELTKIVSWTTYPLFSMLTLNNFLWLLSYMITLYLMKEVGVVMTSLLGMTTMALTIASSYIFFHDIPKKKDILVTMIIIGCIIWGTVF
jgi:drug/metabolite transporter (DMT)-like permease